MFVCVCVCVRAGELTELRALSAQRARVGGKLTHTHTTLALRAKLDSCAHFKRNKQQQQQQHISLAPSNCAPVQVSAQSATHTHTHNDRMKCKPKELRRAEGIRFR